MLGTLIITSVYGRFINEKGKLKSNKYSMSIINVTF